MLKPKVNFSLVDTAVLKTEIIVPQVERGAWHSETGIDLLHRRE